MFASDKINIRKNAFFFLLQVPTHASFDFNSRSSMSLKHVVRLCKTMRGIFHFRLRLVFIKLYIFVQ